MSYDSEMDALKKEETKRGLEILDKYRGATPSGILDNPNETQEFRELMKDIKAKRNAIFKKYGKI
jgi:hypothetical protein